MSSHGNSSSHAAATNNNNNNATSNNNTWNGSSSSFPPSANAENAAPSLVVTPPVDPMLGWQQALQHQQLLQALFQSGNAGAQTQATPQQPEIPALAAAALPFLLSAMNRLPANPGTTPNANNGNPTNMLMDLAQQLPLFQAAASSLLQQPPPPPPPTVEPQVGMKRTASGAAAAPAAPLASDAEAWTAASLLPWSVPQNITTQEDRSLAGPAISEASSSSAASLPAPPPRVNPATVTNNTVTSVPRRPLPDRLVSFPNNTLDTTAAAPAVNTGTRKKLKKSGANSSIATSSACEPCDMDFLAAPVRPDLDWDNLPPDERRRQERNFREQQRSYRISEQIKNLRDILAESNVPFRPNKFSILITVADYIKELQSRSIMLDSEHSKLISTLKETVELVQNGGAASSGSSGEQSQDSDDHKGNNNGSSHQNSMLNDEDLVLVRGLDYFNVFSHAACAMGVASLDGRILAMNEELQELLGSSREAMLRQSLFMFIRNHQDVFEAMADLLKRSSAAASTPEENGDADRSRSNGNPVLFWCGRVVAAASQRVRKFIVDTIVNQDSL
jgi:PAS domain-containing protein